MRVGLRLCLCHVGGLGGLGRVGVVGGSLVLLGLARGAPGSVGGLFQVGRFEGVGLGGRRVVELAWLGRRGRR